MSKHRVIYGEECNICKKFSEYLRDTCCQCEKFICRDCGISCDGCSKFLTCSGKCEKLAKDEVNSLITKFYEVKGKQYLEFEKYKNKVYCGGCYFDVECDLQQSDESFSFYSK